MQRSMRMSGSISSAQVAAKRCRSPRSRFGAIRRSIAPTAGLRLILTRLVGSHDLFCRVKFRYIVIITSGFWYYGGTVFHCWFPKQSFVFNNHDLLGRMGGKRWKTSWLSLIYSSQTCFFVVYGLYRLGLLYGEHPLECVLLLIVYALYVVFNAQGLLLFTSNVDDDEDNGYVFRKLRLKTGDFGYIILGVLGWIINMFVFL